MVNFNITLCAHLPLGIKAKLANEHFPLPISFIYGDNDWVQMLEEDIADIVVSKNKYGVYSDKYGQFDPELLEEGEEMPGVFTSQIHIVPTSDHNMHIDNPQAFANCLINDVYNKNLPIDPNDKLIEIYGLNSYYQTTSQYD